MTAIAGIVAADSNVIGPDHVSALRAAIEVYGRDAWDEWRHTGAGGAGGVGGVLVRALLRTLPEDVHDRQPLWHEPSGTALVFDGRLDNRDELVRALGIVAGELASLADSEVALRAAIAWDTLAAERLRGAFAVACWQPARRRLWLARDAMGHRPLFWHQSPGMIAFASMTPALLALPCVSRKLDELSVAQFLMLEMPSGAQTLFRDIKRVEAGRIVEIVDGAVRVRRFHALDPRRELHLARDEDYLDAFREVLERAVARCLRSCGPVASYLSSGYDSSTITAVTARLLAASGQRLTAYTSVPRLGFAGPVPKGREADESVAAAALVARLPNVDHVIIRAASRSMMEDCRAQARLLGRPVRNPSNTPWMLAIEEDAAARGAKVLLTGQWGNATISLTGRWLPTVLLRQGRWIAWWREARGIDGHRSLPGVAGSLKQSVAPLLPAWAMRALDLTRGRGARPRDDDRRPPDWSPINPSLYSHWHRQGAFEGLNVYPRSWTPTGVREHLIRTLEGNELGDHCVASNASGLDLRDPTKDQDLVEFCTAVPLEQLYRGGQTRWLLRRAMAGVLPPEIMDCKAKGLQVADWFEIVGAELPQIRAEVAAMGASEGVRRFVDVEGLDRSSSLWPRGGWDGLGVTSEFHYRLTRGVIAGMFVRDWLRRA